MNCCSDMTVGKGAGDRRKLLRIDSSEGGIVFVYLFFVLGIDSLSE